MVFQKPLSRRTRGAPTGGASPATEAASHADPSGKSHDQLGNRSSLRRRLMPVGGLILGISICALAAGALFVPGFVFDGEAAAGTDTGTTDTATKAAGKAGNDPITTSDGVLLVTLPWGDGEGEVGLIRPAEGLTRGPEALAVASDGRIAVLDSVNKRVLFLDEDGRPAGKIAVPLTEPRFLAVDTERLYVLDCDADRQVVTLSWDGIALGAMELPELNDVVTGLFATTDGPCVEVAHENVFLVSPASGSTPNKPAAEIQSPTGEVATLQTAGKDRNPTVSASLRSIAGRPVNARMTRAAKIKFAPKTGLQVESFEVDRKSLKAKKTGSSTPALASGRAVEHIVSVDGDSRGDLIIGARLADSDRRRDGREALALTRFASTTDADTLSATGDSTATGAGTSTTMLLDECHFAYLGQPYVVAPDGRVFQPVADENGYSILVHVFAGDETPAEAEEVLP